MRKALAVLLCAPACGCFSVEAVRSPLFGPDVEEHVIVSNYGWNLFGCIPIVCGNAAEDPSCFAAFFRDDVKLDLAYRRLASRAREKGCDVRDLLVMDDRDVVFDFVYAPLPWIIQYREVNVSASLVRKGDR